MVRPSHAQVGQSPYSLNGVGNLQNLAIANQFGMGEVGIATPTRFHVNNMNPALLTYNKLSTFQMGLNIDYRGLATEDLTQTNGGALLNNLIFAFPVMKDKWSMSIGLMPFSNVNYNVTLESRVEGTDTPVINRFEGDGGLVQAYFSHGFVVAKGLSLGLRGSYIFGSIDDVSSSFVGFSRADQLALEELGIEDPLFTRYITKFTRQNTFGDVTLGAGLHYSYQKGEEKRYNVGFYIRSGNEY